MPGNYKPHTPSHFDQASICIPLQKCCQKGCLTNFTLKLLFSNTQISGQYKWIQLYLPFTILFTAQILYLPLKINFIHHSSIPTKYAIWKSEFLSPVHSVNSKYYTSLNANFSHTIIPSIPLSMLSAIISLSGIINVNINNHCDPTHSYQVRVMTL